MTIALAGKIPPGFPILIKWKQIVQKECDTHGSRTLTHMRRGLHYFVPSCLLAKLRKTGKGVFSFPELCHVLRASIAF